MRTGYWVSCRMNISRLKLNIRIPHSVSDAVIGYLNITIQLPVLTVIRSKVEYLKAITAYLKSEMKLWFSKLHNEIFECQNCVFEYRNWTFNFYGNQSAIEYLNFKTAYWNITIEYLNVRTAYLNCTSENLNAKTAYLNIIIELWILMGITLHTWRGSKSASELISRVWIVQVAHLWYLAPHNFFITWVEALYHSETLTIFIESKKVSIKFLTYIGTLGFPNQRSLMKKSLKKLGVVCENHWVAKKKNV